MGKKMYILGIEYLFLFFLWVSIISNSYYLFFIYFVLGIIKYFIVFYLVFKIFFMR